MAGDQLIKDLGETIMLQDIKNIAAIKNAIKVYNENRSLIGKVYELALSDNPPISGSEMYGILMSGLIMPKEAHNAMAKELLDNLPITDTANNSIKRSAPRCRSGHGASRDNALAQSVSISL